MYPPPRSVAVLIATLLHRTGKKRARITGKTLRYISGRTTIRDAFKSEVRNWLDEFGVVMVSLEQRGGFALVARSALEGAPPVLARSHIVDEIRQLARDRIADEHRRTIEERLFEEIGIEPPVDEE